MELKGAITMKIWDLCFCQQGEEERNYTEFTGFNEILLFYGYYESLCIYFI